MKQEIDKQVTEVLQNTNTRTGLENTVPDLQTQLAFAIAKSVKKRGLRPKKVIE